MLTLGSQKEPGLREEQTQIFPEGSLSDMFRVGWQVHWQPFWNFSLSLCMLPFFLLFLLLSVWKVSSLSVYISLTLTLSMTITLVLFNLFLSREDRGRKQKQREKYLDIILWLTHNSIFGSTNSLKQLTECTLYMLWLKNQEENSDWFEALTHIWIQISEN